MEPQAIDVERARRQHARYRDALLELGCTVIALPADDTLPDSVFVEDTAVVVDECAVITRPGAESRRGETDAVAQVLERFRTVSRMESPALLDGGDVLRVGKRVWVGLTTRTNRSGLLALRAALEPSGYTVQGVELDECLHLKTAVTALTDGLLVANTSWVDPRCFDPLEVIAADPSEPFAGNVLRVGERVVVAAAVPRTRELLESRAISCVAVDISELAKAEAGLTCLSIVFEGS